MQDVADGLASYPAEHTTWVANTDPAEAARQAAHCWNVNKFNKATILRDIVGNPFRPCLSLYQLGVMVEHGSPPRSYTVFDLAWLTPTVVALAKAAYGERDRPCPCPQFGYDTGEYHALCARCQGRGTVNDGTLDNDRLAVLADALEEAGCPAQIVVTVTAGMDCPVCGCKGWSRHGAHFDHMRKCTSCKAASWEPGEEYHFRTAHPLIEHLRSSGPHYYGCHVLEAILFPWEKV